MAKRGGAGSQGDRGWKNPRYRRRRISKGDWLNRLDIVRTELGDTEASSRLGLSAARGRKTMHEWMVGRNEPSQSYYDRVNKLYRNLSRKGFTIWEIAKRAEKTAESVVDDPDMIHRMDDFDKYLHKFEAATGGAPRFKKTTIPGTDIPRVTSMAEFYIQRNATPNASHFVGLYFVVNTKSDPGEIAVFWMVEERLRQYESMDEAMKFIASGIRGRFEHEEGNKSYPSVLLAFALGTMAFDAESYRKARAEMDKGTVRSSKTKGNWKRGN